MDTLHFGMNGILEEIGKINDMYILFEIGEIIQRKG